MHTQIAFDFLLLVKKLNIFDFHIKLLLNTYCTIHDNCFHIQSPLQVLRIFYQLVLKQYQGNYQLSHFDAYRLEGQSEDLGFEEIFDSDDICVVEWPEFLEDILPQERLASK